MFTRANIAGFLQGLFVLPLCALFGGLIALLFHARGGALAPASSFCALFPFAGAVKTRQWALLAGLLAGIGERSGLPRSTPARMKTLFALLVLLGMLTAPRSRRDAPAPLRGFIVCLDPGHASETSQGTASRDGKLTELHVNWVVAQRLKTPAGSRRARQSCRPKTREAAGRHEPASGGDRQCRPCRSPPAPALRFGRTVGPCHLLPRPAGNALRRHRPFSRPSSPPAAARRLPSSRPLLPL